METVFLALRVAVALGAVFGALLLGHRWITKGRPGAPVRGRRIEVVARQGLGAKAGVAIVDAAGRRYLLGVTEHAVTVLDTLPVDPTPTGRVSLVSATPIAAPSFERELQTVQLATGAVPVLVHGRGDPHDPSGPVTQALAILPADEPPATRRSLREAEQRRAAGAGPLAGSVLSPSTWRQTIDAVRRIR